MRNNDAVDSQAPMEITSKSGNKYDTNNIPGSKRMELINNGEISADSFIAPANMPGGKLKEMRDKFKQSLGLMEKPKSPAALPDNIKLKEGMAVAYKGFNTSIEEVLEDGRVRIRTESNKIKKVQVSDLELPIDTIDLDEEEHNERDEEEQEEVKEKPKKSKKKKKIRK